MRAIARAAIALFLIGIGGCGGGGGPVTRVLTQNLPSDVPAGSCTAVAGPYSVGRGSMAFTIADTPTGIGDDSMEAGIMFDSDFLAGGCDFNIAIVDDVQTGSFSDSGPVPAGTYAFVVGCNNVLDPCLFDLTWTATY
jgi:hypothetical protein